MNVEKIKEIRKNLGITLKVLAKATGYTESYLSQIERGLKNPSIEALRRISEALRVPIITFLVDSDNEKTPSESQYVVIDKVHRKKIHIPNITSSQEMITPVFGDIGESQRFQGFIISIEKGESVSEKLISHLADESILITKGRLTVIVGEERFEIKTGDSLYITGGTLHNYINEYDEITEMIVYMSSDV